MATSRQNSGVLLFTLTGQIVSTDEKTVRLRHRCFYRCFCQFKLRHVEYFVVVPQQIYIFHGVVGEEILKEEVQHIFFVYFKLLFDDLIMNNDELPFLLGNSGMVQTESNNI